MSVLCHNGVLLYSFVSKLLEVSRKDGRGGFSWRVEFMWCLERAEDGGSPAAAPPKKQAWRSTMDV